MDFSMFAQLLLAGIVGLISFALGRAYGSVRAVHTPPSSPVPPASREDVSQPVKRTGSPAPQEPNEDERRFIRVMTEETELYDYLEARANEEFWFERAGDIPLEDIHEDEEGP